MFAAQDRDVLDDLINVIGAVELGKTRAAPDRAVEACDRNVSKAAIRSIIDKVDPVIGCSGRARAVRGQESLIKIVEAEPNRVDQRRSWRVVPLRSGELGI